MTNYSLNNKILVASDKRFVANRKLSLRMVQSSVYEDFFCLFFTSMRSYAIFSKLNRSWSYLNATRAYI